MSNYAEFLAGTDPANPDTDGDGARDGDDPAPLDPLVGGARALAVYNAFAVYTNGMTNVYVQADIRSTNALVTVSCAEFFHTFIGTNGAGEAMFAADGQFDSTNEVARLAFTPSFPPGERHVLWLHAQSNTGQWSQSAKVIVNPNIHDILNKIEANYSAIQDLQYDVAVTRYIDDVQQEDSAAFHVQQKRGYMLRQTDAATGLITIMNGNRTAYLDGQGQYQGGIEAETIANMQSGATSINGAPYYWDTPGFRGDFPGITNAPVLGTTNGIVNFQLMPRDTNAVCAADLVVDFGRGIPVQEEYHGSDGVCQQLRHDSPVLVGSKAWLPTNERIKTVFPDGRTMEWRTVISNVQINQGLADALFAIPSPPGE